MWAVRGLGSATRISSVSAGMGKSVRRFKQLLKRTVFYLSLHRTGFLLQVCLFKASFSMGDVNDSWTRERTKHWEILFLRSWEWDEKASFQTLCVGGEAKSRTTTPFSSHSFTALRSTFKSCPRLQQQILMNKAKILDELRKLIQAIPTEWMHIVDNKSRCCSQCSSSCFKSSTVQSPVIIDFSIFFVRRASVLLVSSFVLWFGQSMEWLKRCWGVAWVADCLVWGYWMTTRNYLRFKLSLSNKTAKSSCSR